MPRPRHGEPPHRRSINCIRTDVHSSLRYRFTLIVIVDPLFSATRIHPPHCYRIGTSLPLYLIIHLLVPRCCSSLSFTRSPYDTSLFCHRSSPRAHPPTPSLLLPSPSRSLALTRLPGATRVLFPCCTTRAKALVRLSSDRTSATPSE